MGLLDVIKRWFQPRHGTQAWIEIGQEALSRGELDEAEEAFLKANDASPNSGSATSGLIQIALLRDHVARALNLYEQMPERQQRQYSELLMIALSLQTESITPRAYALWMRLPSAGPDRLKGLRELCQRHPKCGFLAGQWAELALQSFQLEEADAALRLLRDAEPNLPERQVALLYARRDVAQLKEHTEVARVLEEASQLEEPTARLRRLEPLANDYMFIAPLQHDTGLAFFQAGRPEVAIRYINRAVGVNPYWVNAWVHLGSASLAAHRKVRARTAFARVLRLQNHEWISSLYERLDEELSRRPELTLLEKALDRMDVGDPWGAILPLRKALESRDDDPALLRALAEARFALREFHLALPIFAELWKKAKKANATEQTSELQHKVELCAHRLAVSLISERKYKEAGERLSEITALGDGFSMVTDDLHLLQRLQSGDISEAAFQAYEKAHPSRGLSSEKQLLALEDALQESSAFPEALLARAVLLAEKGDLERAKSDLEQALRWEKDPWRIRFHQAGLAFLQQDPTLARKWWQDCSEAGVGPWSRLASENLRALSSGTAARLTIVALPEHRRVIEFSPATGETEVPSEILAESAKIAEKSPPAQPAQTGGHALQSPALPAKELRKSREAFADALADVVDDPLAIPPMAAPSSSSMEMPAIDASTLEAIEKNEAIEDAPSTPPTETVKIAEKKVPQGGDDLFPDARSGGAIKILSPEEAIRLNTSILEKDASAPLDEPSDFFAKEDDEDIFAKESYPLTDDAAPNLGGSDARLSTIEPSSFITPSFFDLPSAPQGAQTPPPPNSIFAIPAEEETKPKPISNNNDPLFSIDPEEDARPLAFPPQAQKEWDSANTTGAEKDDMWEAYQTLSKQKVPRLSDVLSQPDKPLQAQEEEEHKHQVEAQEALAGLSLKNQAPDFALAPLPPSESVPELPKEELSLQAPSSSPSQSQAESSEVQSAAIKAPVSSSVGVDDLFGTLDVSKPTDPATPEETPKAPVKAEEPIAKPDALDVKADVVSEAIPPVTAAPVIAEEETKTPPQKSEEAPAVVAEASEPKASEPEPKAPSAAKEAPSSSSMDDMFGSLLTPASVAESSGGGSSLLDDLGGKMSFHETFPSNDELLSFLDDAIEEMQVKKSSKKED
ncbi:MAG: hypothetical protein H6728_09470 [Myxococcales bacterium]|nr:hypothetical protein [Myxococcales bacterium]